MTVTSAQFIRRFLLHTSPKGLHRLRHYGPGSDEIKGALDPRERGLQFLASEVAQLEGIRLAGMVMTRQKGGRERRR